jgi:hypothetical protein
MGEPTPAAAQGESSEFMQHSCQAHLGELASPRAEVRRWLAPFALAGDAEDDLALAVNEAASNSVEHAYTPPTAHDTVELTFWTEPHAICLEIVDHGQGQWRVPSGEPTGRSGNRDDAAARRVRADPARQPPDPSALPSPGARRLLSPRRASGCASSPGHLVAIVAGELGLCRGQRSGIEPRLQVQYVELRMEAHAA